MIMAPFVVSLLTTSIATWVPLAPRYWAHGAAVTCNAGLMPRANRLTAQLFGEGDFDGEEDEYEEALSRYEALGIFDGGGLGQSAAADRGDDDDDDDDDDTTPEMMLELSMQVLEQAQQSSSPSAMQAAVAAAIDAAALVEAAKAAPDDASNATTRKRTRPPKLSAAVAAAGWNAPVLDEWVRLADGRYRGRVGAAELTVTTAKVDGVLAQGESSALATEITSLSGRVFQLGAPAALTAALDDPSDTVRLATRVRGASRVLRAAFVLYALRMAIALLLGVYVGASHAPSRPQPPVAPTSAPSAVSPERSRHLTEIEARLRRDGYVVDEEMCALPQPHARPMRQPPNPAHELPGM